MEGIDSDKLQLLKTVSGEFRPGVLTALMGVSGAGKTTLMDVLAGRKTGGYIEGDIRVSGYPKVQETFARIAGYVEQTDIHSPQVTVHESLTYSSWLRLPKDVDPATREVIDSLFLMGSALQMQEVFRLQLCLVMKPIRKFSFAILMVTFNSHLDMEMTSGHC